LKGHLFTPAAHPRGRGDPVFAKQYAPSSIVWIPAFAGMSGLILPAQIIPLTTLGKKAKGARSAF
jgi:hypothetical protein